MNHDVNAHWTASGGTALLGIKKISTGILILMSFFLSTFSVPSSFLSVLVSREKKKMDREIPAIEMPTHATANPKSWSIRKEKGENQKRRNMSTHQVFDGPPNNGHGGSLLRMRPAATTATTGR